MADGPVIPPPLRSKLTPAQAELVESVRRPLRCLAEDLVKGPKPTDADDLVQLGLEIACKRAPEHQPGKAKFLTFIYQEVRRAMIDALKADDRQRRLMQAVHRAAKEVHASIEVGDLLEETAQMRLERRDVARYALAAAAVIGMSQAPRNPEELFMDAQEQQRLRAFVELELAKLDPVDRRLIELCTMEGTTVADAARAVGLPYDPARYRFMTMLAKVGERLGPRLDR